MSQFRKGQLVSIEYEGREFTVIVINPNGLGKDQPSVGFGYRMMTRHAGIPANTLSDWTTEESIIEGVRQIEQKVLKPPSGNVFKVFDIKGEDNNDYLVVEATDWFDLAFDILENPGRTGRTLKSKLLAFIKWFTVKGFYSEVYVALKGNYTEKDSRTLSKWLLSRLSGIVRRKEYTNFLQAQGCEDSGEYGYWTDYVYMGLFGKTASQMKNSWKLIEGNKHIGRNYIPEAERLDAVAYCEEMTVKLHFENLNQAHDDAIKYTLSKYFNGKQPAFEL